MIEIILMNARRKLLLLLFRVPTVKISTMFWKTNNLGKGAHQDVME